MAPWIKHEMWVVQKAASGDRILGGITNLIYGLRAVKV